MTTPVKKTPPVKKKETRIEAELTEELDSKMKVIHKVTEQEFLVSREYYLANKGSLKIA